MSASHHPQAMLARALYRASLRCVRSLDGGALPLQRSIKANEWGKFQRLSAQQLETERLSVFPWASASESSDGTIAASALLALARRRYRETPASRDETDAALNEAFAAIRGFGELFERLQTSSTSVTEGVRIQAVSKFLGVSDDSGAHVFAYRIRIANTTARVVQLRSRHWIIEDEHGGSIVVPKGSPGVVGQTPRLRPDEYFEYVSGTELHAPKGAIRGSFEFVYDDGQTFDAVVDKFDLLATTP
mmetsp:Transcript_9866/g.31688  ORF Transcript_9866/g.31688 Transcript_9866/m.31688 type:complete len:246 (+) Transcript_9866:41-778(+)